MKHLFGLFALVAISAATANAASTATVQFTGQSAETITLDSVKYRTEYQEREVVRTCYREEFRGYRWECPRGPYPGPYPGPRPGPGPRPVPPRPYPGPGPGPGCRQVPVYVQVPYSCVVRERVPVQVFDANVIANIEMSFGDLPQGVSANETFEASLDGDQLSVSVKGSGKLLIGENMTTGVARLGNTIQLTANSKYSFVDAAPVVQAFAQGMDALSVLNGTVTMNVSPAIQDFASGLSVQVIQHRSLAADRELLNRTFPFSIFAMKSVGGATNISANYSTLGLPVLDKGKYEFIFTMEAALPGMRIMNADQFGSALKAQSIMNLRVK